jgi:leader peptidase (prepilin peptidase)/N-methyltransferase
MSTADFLNASPALFVLLAGLTGLIVGSFLNVVIYRLPRMMERQWRAQCAELLDHSQKEGMHETFNLWTPGSRCPACRHPISPTENIPILSYLLQRGRCAHCATPISVQYPAVEATSALLAAIVAWHYGPGWQAAAAMLLTWSLIALSVIDFNHKLLPDVITLPFMWLGMGIALFGVFTDLQSSVVGAMSGYLSLWLVFHAFRILTGKDGMGFGDFKLLAMLGAWQGWQNLLPIVIVSSCVGAVLGIVLILVGGQNRNTPMPFGPFLAAAGWITLLWGEPLNRFYGVSLWSG